MKKILLSALLVTSFGSPAQASVSRGLIENVAVNFAGTARVRIAGITDLAECGESFSGFAIDVNTDGGQALYALALSAQAQARPVNAAGRGVCDIRGDTESIQFLTIPEE